jgi:dipeptidyl aminopeptidase/acylaminoacyl peptidase
MPRFSPDGKQICFLTNAPSHLYAFHQSVLIRSLDDQKIHTPCLIQHGSCDKRVPPKQAVDYYHALKKEGKTATLFLYPNMEHGCTNPSQQIELMQQNLDWFKTYLMH